MDKIKQRTPLLNSIRVFFSLEMDTHFWLVVNNCEEIKFQL